MSLISINADLCTSCGICAQSCPVSVIDQKEQKKVPTTIHEHLCYSCGQCVAVCPSGAITHDHFPDGRIIPIHNDLRPSFEQIREMLRSRRSIRAFKNKPVDKDLINKIIDGARFAPSGMNQQTTRFVVIQDKTVINKISEITYLIFSKWIRLLKNPFIRKIAPLAGKEARGMIRVLDELEIYTRAYENGDDIILHHAPLLIIFHGEDGFAFSDINAVLAFHNASLISWGLGLGCFISGLVIAACKKDKRIPRLLSIPENHQVYGALVIGYPRFNYRNWIERRPPQIKWI